MSTPHVNLWTSPEHALEYLDRADSIPHRTEGEEVLLDALPREAGRILDLGSGDGRLLALVKLASPGVRAVAVDFSPPMLDRLRSRFESDATVVVAAHDLSQPLPPLGAFDAVVSSFAIHHLDHGRKRALFAEIHGVLAPGGVFLNLEHVASPTPALHARFLAALAIQPGEEDPSNQLLDMETQLEWLREIGYHDVDCLWKWRELALFGGSRGAEPGDYAKLKAE